jgi:hypothetical protein
MPICAEFISMNEIVQKFQKITGQKAVFHEIPMDQFSKSGQPGAEELVLNMKFFVEHQEKVRDPEFSRKIYPDIMDWEKFLSVNQAKLLETIPGVPAK